MNTLTKIGAMWQHRSRKDNRLYLSGEIEINGEKKRVLLFRNTLKETDKHPDWNILMEENNQTSTPEQTRSGEENHNQKTQNLNSHKSVTRDNNAEISTQNNVQETPNLNNAIPDTFMDDKQLTRYDYEEKVTSTDKKAGAVYWV